LNPDRSSAARILIYPCCGDPVPHQPVASRRAAVPLDSAMSPYALLPSGLHRIIPHPSTRARHTPFRSSPSQPRPQSSTTRSRITRLADFESSGLASRVSPSLLSQRAVDCLAPPRRGRFVAPFNAPRRVNAPPSGDRFCLRYNPSRLSATATRYSHVPRCAMAKLPNAAAPRSRSPPRRCASAAPASSASAYRTRKGGKSLRTRAGDKNIKGERLEEEGATRKEDGREGGQAEEEKEGKERGRILAELAGRIKVLRGDEAEASLKAFFDGGKETAGKETEAAGQVRGSDVTATGEKNGEKDGQGGQDVIIGGQVVRVTQEDIDIAEMIDALEMAFEKLEEERDAGDGDGDGDGEEKGRGKGKGKGEREGKGEEERGGKLDGKGEGEGKAEAAKTEGKDGGKREEGRVEGDEDADTEEMEYDIEIDLGELWRDVVVRWLLSWNLGASWEGDVQTLTALLEELYTNEVLVMTQERANEAMAAAVRAGTRVFRANLERELVWYDADGKVVTEWTDERVSVYVAGTLSLLLDISIDGNTVPAFPPAALNWLDERDLRSEIFGPGAAVDIVTCVPGPFGGKVFAFELPEGREAGEVYAALDARLRKRFPGLEVSLDSMQYAMDVGDDMFKGGGDGSGGENDREGGWGGGGGGGDGGGGGGNWNEWDQFQTGNAPTFYNAGAAFIVRRDVFLQPGLPLAVTAFASAFTLLSLKSLLQPDLALSSPSDLAWALLGLYAGVSATAAATIAAQYLWAWSYRKESDKPPSPLFFLPLFAPDVGLVTLVTQIVAPIPSRTALLDLTLLSSSASILASFALLQASAAFPFPPAPFSFPSDLSSLGFDPAVSKVAAAAAAAASAAGGSVPGVIPVNPGLLQHSALLHELLIRLSTTVIRTPDPAQVQAAAEAAAAAAVAAAAAAEAAAESAAATAAATAAAAAGAAAGAADAAAAAADAIAALAASSGLTNFNSEIASSFASSVLNTASGSSSSITTTTSTITSGSGGGGEDIIATISAAAADISNTILATASSSSSSVETLVIHPLALAGLLGLHFSAISLLPAVGLPGGDILYSLFRDPVVLSLATTTVTILLLFSIPLNFSWVWPLLFLLLPLLALAKIKRPVSEAITAPDPVRACLGVGLLLAGVAVILPAPLFELVFGGPAGPVAEQILISLGLV
ncbi:hypothetical protein CLOP_g2217, partial [Closterium sp. NIES-67]